MLAGMCKVTSAFSQQALIDARYALKGELYDHAAAYHRQYSNFQELWIVSEGLLIC